MIEVKNLSFAFGKFVVFQDFNFQSDDQLISFKGVSGCGKTTLLKLLSGNYKAFHAEKLYISGKPFLVLQEDSLCPWLSGVNNITQLLKISIEDCKKNSLFHHTKSFIEKKACNLSFGQRRMIELLRALSFNPDILMLDEPFNYLDKISREKVTQSLLEFASNSNKRIVMTSHYNEDFDTLKPISYYFNGLFPISSITNEKNNI